MILRLLSRLLAEAHNFHGRVCAYCGWPRPTNKVDNPDMAFSTEGYSAADSIWKPENPPRIVFEKREDGRPALYYIAPPNELEGGIWDNTAPPPAGTRLVDAFRDGMWLGGEPFEVRGGNAGGGKTDAFRRSLTVTVKKVPDWLQKRRPDCSARPANLRAGVEPNRATLAIPDAPASANLPLVCDRRAHRVLDLCCNVGLVDWRQPMRSRVRQQYSCKNPNCNDRVSYGFCLSCRHMAKRTAARWFPVAVVIGGILWAIISRKLGL